MLVAPSAIATAIDTSAITPVEKRGLPRALQRRSQPAGQPRLVGRLPQQHRPGVPDQARPAAGDRQAWSHAYPA